MLRIIKKLMIPICFLGIVMYMIQFVPGIGDQLEGLTYISKVPTAYGAYYKIDIMGYAKGLENSFEGQYIWANIWPNWPNLPENNLLVVPNMLIYVVKIFSCIAEAIFILPLKIIVYPINIVLQLVGFNTDNGFRIIAEAIINLHIPQPSYF